MSEELKPKGLLPGDIPEEEFEPEEEEAPESTEEEKDGRGGARHTKAKDPKIPEDYQFVRRPLTTLKVGGVMPGAGGSVLGALMAGFTPEYIIDDRKFINFKTWDWNFSPYNTRFSMMLQMHREVPIDLMVGSPSCAKFSRRGKKIIDGKRLEELPPELFEYVKFLHEVMHRRPRFFIVENVVGVRRYFYFEKHPEGGYVLKAENFKTGVWLKDWEIQEEISDTYDYGLPQYRKRLYLIGSLREYEFTYRTPKYLKSSTLKEAIDDLRGKLDQVANHETPEHDEARVQSFKDLKPGEAAYGSFNNKKLPADAAAPTVTGGASRVVHYTDPRILTPRECARLMGYPDDFVFWGGVLQQYDQVGKGLAPPIIEHMAAQIRATMEKKGDVQLPEAFKPKRRLFPKINISISRGDV